MRPDRPVYSDIRPQTMGAMAENRNQQDPPRENIAQDPQQEEQSQVWMNPNVDPMDAGMFDMGYGWQESDTHLAEAMGYDSNPNGTYNYSSHPF